MENIETENTAKCLGKHSKGMERSILRIMKGQHPNKFADNLETYVRIIWKCTPDGHSLNPVNWVEIAELWLEKYK